MEGRSGGQKQGMNKGIRQTDKAKARQRGCGYFHYCSAFNCASSHCYQLPDEGLLRPQPGIQCTQLKDLECILYATRVMCRSESYLDLGRACFLPSGRGGMFTREEVTFLHFVRLGEFCSARHGFGAFPRVGALRGRMVAYAGYATSEKGLVDQVMDGHSRRFGSLVS